MIPKTIHYIWLGPNKKPETWAGILKSWETYAPSYSIKEWDDTSLVEFDLPPYFHRAIQEKKYAFASDVLRCHILARYGGIYFDIDEKLLRPLPEEFLNADFFTAYYHNKKDYFGFQLTGSVREGFIMKEMIEVYRTYKATDGYEIINSLLSKVLCKYMLEHHAPVIKTRDAADLYTVENQKIKIFPQEYFYPEEVHGHNFSHAYAVHLGNTSWIPTWKKMLYRVPGYNFFKQAFLYIAPKSIQSKLFTIRYK